MRRGAEARCSCQDLSWPPPKAAHLVRLPIPQVGKLRPGGGGGEGCASLHWASLRLWQDRVLLDFGAVFVSKDLRQSVETEDLVGARVVERACGQPDPISDLTLPFPGL